MTNLFAELREEGHIDEFDISKKPILCDITNVDRYVKKLEGESIPIDQLVPKLPWDMVWYEFSTEKGVIGALNINSEDDNIYVIVFTKILYEYITDIPLMGYERISNNDGEYLREELCINNKFNMYNEASKEIIDGIINYASICSCYASTFCHCKNVEYYDKNHSEALQKANKKRGKIPQETYRILDIEGLTKQAKSESTKERGELQTALHICRGHFKTYTEENPLFGKHTGIYWWPMHKRGSEKNGKVNKDYKIHTE